MASSGQTNRNTQQFFCADCNASDPQWASLNRGVLICCECCYVHRNLGRHVSYVRSLKKGAWDKNQLELVFVLYANGSNNIWEHSLLDPIVSNKNVKKPKSIDPVFPIKEIFIKTKYVQLAYVLRPSKDDAVINQEDLNRQLWSCVRTAHVETTLRLLALGANPNYVDPEKKNAPLHVAAKEGQSLQVELLWLYGADARQINGADLTPSQVAKLENHIELSMRLEELQFEVTNKLSLYLCGRRPDHSKQQYFLVPDLVGADEESGKLRHSRRMLYSLTPLQFERIVQDVYDEVDRREIASSWNAVMQGMAVHPGIDQCVAAFLPPNPDLSATRNQLRQKLAKLTVREFAVLIIDVLTDAKRRYFGLPLSSDFTAAVNGSTNKANGAFSGMQEYMMTTNDFVTREYDEVAISSNSKENAVLDTPKQVDKKSEVRDSMLQTIVNVSIDDYLHLKDRVLETESTLTALVKGNGQILRTLSTMQSSIDHIMADNVDLQAAMKGIMEKQLLPNDKRHLKMNATLSRTNLKPCMPPPITRSYSSSYQVNATRNQSESETERSQQRRNSLAYAGGGSDISNVKSIFNRNGSAPPTEYGSASEMTEMEECVKGITGLDHSEKAAKGKKHCLDFREIFNSGVFPDNLIIETEVLTHTIKLLLADAQVGRLINNATHHAHAIALQIDRIMSVVPEDKRNPAIEQCLKEMLDATVLLSAKCNYPFLGVDETCNAAYSVAKAAKQLLVSVHQQ